MSGYVRPASPGRAGAIEARWEGRQVRLFFPGRRPEYDLIVWLGWDEAQRVASLLRKLLDRGPGEQVLLPEPGDRFSPVTGERPAVQQLIWHPEGDE